MFQPFRTAAIVLPEANQSIYGDGHVGHKYVTTSEENEEKVSVNFENFQIKFTNVDILAIQNSTCPFE